ncbi:MAG: hypothetical protein PVJ61_00995 [Dehalococcoidia bacterium]|jgi:hypothetical protein
MAKREMEPKGVDTVRLMKEDKNFLLAMLDNPTKAYNMYNIRLDRESLDKLGEISARIRVQAIEAFGEMKKWIIINNCDGCNNCSDRFLDIEMHR